MVSSNPVLFLAFFVLGPPSTQWPKPESWPSETSPPIPTSGVTKSILPFNIFHICFFLSTTATTLVQNLPCNRSLCPLPCLPPAACHIADRAINFCHCFKLFSISLCFHFHMDNEAPFWLALQAWVLPVPLTPMLTMAPWPLGMSLGWLAVLFRSSPTYARTKIISQWKAS